ncbi:hypothetical protein AWH04_04515 [Rhodococcus erythropolis]|jgi:hypothetical protein|nr:hypothetical protein AWH04_04515 [Rhodococcus erythropolis]
MTFADLDGDELWSYLKEHSGLPGPRANLGLMLEFARGSCRGKCRRRACLSADYGPQPIQRFGI